MQLLLDPLILVINQRIAEQLQSIPDMGNFQLFGLADLAIVNMAGEDEATAPVVITPDGDGEFIYNISDQPVTAYHRLLKGTFQDVKSVGHRPNLGISLHMALVFIVERSTISVADLGLIIPSWLDSREDADVKRSLSASNAEIVVNGYNSNSLEVLSSEFKNAPDKYKSPNFGYLKVDYKINAVVKPDCFKFC